MKILISNDDGVQAIGLNVLAKELATFSEVDVIAPDRNRSGASNSLTLENPLRVREMENGYLCVEGTPTDCVHLGLTGLLPHQPDLVVAGINQGANLGDDVLYSGTIAAATEGRFLGFPSIAVSLLGHDPTHYDTAAHVVKKIVHRLAEKPLPIDTILSINVPDLPVDQLRGMEVTRLGTRHCAEPTVREEDPRGNIIYWVGPAGAEQDAGPGTDFYAVNNNYVSITPLQFDLTHYKAFAQLAGWVSGLQVE